MTGTRKEVLALLAALGHRPAGSAQLQKRITRKIAHDKLLTPGLQRAMSGAVDRAFGLNLAEARIEIFWVNETTVKLRIGGVLYWQWDAQTGEML